MASDAIRQELNRMKLDELRVLSRDLGLRGVSGASKPELLQQLSQLDDATLEGTLRSSTSANSPMHYQPALWEKITAASVAVAIVGLVGYLVIREKPVEGNLATFVRILLSLAISVIGATVPGFLSIGVSASGLLIRAGGALALFVLTYFFAPDVVPNIDPTTVFTIQDRTTNQRIDRTFTLDYQLDGPGKTSTDSNQIGRVTIPARSTTEVEVLDVRCDGYTFDRQDESVLWLSRVEPDVNDPEDDRDDEFLLSITPEQVPTEYATVSPADYAQSITSDVPPGEVVFTVYNKTDDSLDVLYQHYTLDGSDDFAGWRRLSCCPPTKFVQLSGFGKPGGYFFIFASRFGRRAAFIDLRNLYQSRTTNLYIKEVSGNLIPEWEHLQ